MIKSRIDNVRVPSQVIRLLSRRVFLSDGITLLLLCANLHAYAGAGPLGIDHEWALDQSGIWARKYQTGLEAGVIAAEVAGAIYFGDDDEFGHVLWQSVDSTIISGASAEVMKYTFARARPDQGGNSKRWFKGRCCQSFPSGEVTLQAAFVTPFIANFARDTPWIWALEALPAYDSVARLKSQAHWQTDVIAGWALGTAIGYWTTTRAVPFSVQVLPRGLTIGYSHRF